MTKVLFWWTFGQSVLNPSDGPNFFPAFASPRTQGQIPLSLQGCSYPQSSQASFGAFPRPGHNLSHDALTIAASARGHERRLPDWRTAGCHLIAISWTDSSYDLAHYCHLSPKSPICLHAVSRSIPIPSGTSLPRQQIWQPLAFRHWARTCPAARILNLFLNQLHSYQLLSSSAARYRPILLRIRVQSSQQIQKHSILAAKSAPPAVNPSNRRRNRQQRSAKAPICILSIAIGSLSIRSLNLPSFPRVFFTFSASTRIDKTRWERIQYSDRMDSFSEIGPISCYFMGILRPETKESRAHNIWMFISLKKFSVPQ